MMKSAVLALFATSVISQSVLRAKPGMMSRPMPALPSMNSGRYTFSAPSAMSDKAVDYEPQDSLGRRTFGALMSAGALGASFMNPAQAAKVKAPPSDETPLLRFGTGDKSLETQWGSQPLRQSTCAPFKDRLQFKGQTTGYSKGEVGDPIVGYAIALPSAFPDLSSCEGISFVAKSNLAETVPELAISLGNRNGYGQKSYYFKAKFAAPPAEYSTVKVPFKDFESDPYAKVKSTGVSKAVLQKAQSVKFWGQGKNGKVDLDIKEINAYGCKAAALYEDDTADNSYLVLLAAASVGMMVVFFVHSQSKRRAPITPPLLG